MPHYDIGYFQNKVKRKKFGNIRKIKNRYIAWKLDKDYYDGDRINGYGGFKYDARWKSLLPDLINKYKLTKKSKVSLLASGGLINKIFSIFFFPNILNNASSILFL